MLQPKKMKYRKQFRGKNRGVALRGSEIAYGDFALKSVENGWITARQLEAARKKITFVTKRAGMYWLRVFPHKSVTLKPVGVKMGSGKGDIDHYVAVVQAGTIIFEIAGVPEIMAKEAFKKAGHKLAVSTVFIGK